MKMLDLFSVNVQSKEIVELSSNGLDQIVIPEPAPSEEKGYGTIEEGEKVQAEAGRRFAPSAARQERRWRSWFGRDPA
jgi:hypothetical protein